MSAQQLTLESVSAMYEGVASLSNEELYSKLVDAGIVKQSDLNKVEAVGEKCKTSKLKRKIRWIQQSLKQAGVISPTDQRGVWSMGVNEEGIDSSLHTAPHNVLVLGFSTELGISVWGDSRQLMGALDQPIQLCFSSLPYPLQNPRKYGNKPLREYIDFALSIIEPVARNLADGGSIVINLSNDIFLKGTPARSSYLERLVIALEDELDLVLMDRIVWHNPNKPPAPTQWATNPQRPHHLKVAYEPVYWFTNNPSKIKANNRNVLQPNSEKMMALYNKGGDNRATNYGDGSYRLHKSSYAVETAGTLPSNVLTMSSTCSDTKRVHQIAKNLGLPTHGAMFPSRLPEFFIKWLTDEGDLVVDPCSGTNRVGLMAELLGRCWASAERIAEYIQLQRALFLSHNIKLT